MLHCCEKRNQLIRSVCFTGWLILLLWLNSPWSLINDQNRPTACFTWSTHHLDAVTFIGRPAWQCTGPVHYTPRTLNGTCVITSYILEETYYYCFSSLLLLLLLLVCLSFFLCFLHGVEWNVAIKTTKFLVTCYWLILVVLSMCHGVSHTIDAKFAFFFIFVFTFFNADLGGMVEFVLSDVGCAELRVVMWPLGCRGRMWERSWGRKKLGKNRNGVKKQKMSSEGGGMVGWRWKRLGNGEKTGQPPMWRLKIKADFWLISSWADVVHGLNMIVRGSVVEFFYSIKPKSSPNVKLGFCSRPPS